jgi:hypothetical protein
MRSFQVAILVILLTGCGDPQQPEIDANLTETTAADASDFDSPTLPTTTEGKPIDVQSDPGATYRLLAKSKLPNGNLEVISRRDGPSGTSFARREVDCGSMTFRYLGEGDTLDDAKLDSPNIGEMSEAMSTSISGEISRFACS